MRGFLKSKGCWPVVECGLGSNPTPEMLVKEEKAVGALLISIDDNAVREVKKCETAKEVWDQLHKLRTLFDP